LYLTSLVALVLFAPNPLHARGKSTESYGVGLNVSVPASERDVLQAVQDVAADGIIQGSKEYNKDEYVGGADATDSTSVFPKWTGSGKVFYKVREQALDPRNFKDSNDVGTLVVRYVVLPQGEKNTVLRIDALFEETFRRIVHQSNGSVESSEYKDIHDHLEAMELMKQQTSEAEKERQTQLARKQQLSAGIEAPIVAGRESSSKQAEDHPESSVQSDMGESSAQSLEQHVKDLRRQVERLVKAPGAPLKSAPFHTASTLQSLASGTEVMIVISTPYWYGVETHDGQHGWIPRDQLEQLP